MNSKLNIKPMTELIHTQYDIFEKFNRSSALKLVQIDLLDDELKFKLQKYLSFSVYYYILSICRTMSKQTRLAE